ncbi:hypothetical protein QEN19_003985 [Hanseniaspora menglaensis]
MSQAEPMGADFSVLNIPFYTNLTSILNNSIYTFSSTDSMMLFKETGNKLSKQGSIQQLPNGQYIGVPLFQCLLKKDASYLIGPESMNYQIYKFIIIPADEKNPDKVILEEKYLKDREYKSPCFNEEHNINIYRVLFSEVKSKKVWLSLSREREYVFKFRNANLKMLYKNFRDHIDVSQGPFENSRWIYNDNYGNVFIDGFFINNNYKLYLSDGSVACEFDNTNRTNKWILHTKNEEMGLLRFANYNMPPAFSKNEKILNHNNDFLTDFNELIVCMTFVLLNHKRYEKQARRRRNN